MFNSSSGAPASVVFGFVFGVFKLFTGTFSVLWLRLFVTTSKFYFGVEEIYKGAIRAASLSPLTVLRDTSLRFNKDAKPVSTFFAFSSDSPLRWRSSCWLCCKAPGPLARPCLWVWHRSSSDPASAQSCSRCPALSSGGSRPRNLGKRRWGEFRTACDTMINMWEQTTSDFWVYWFTAC